MENRFLEMDDYLERLSGRKGRCKSLKRNGGIGAGNGGSMFPSFQSSLWSQPFSAGQRVLVILIENSGSDLYIPELVTKLFEIIPGADAIPNETRQKVVTYLRDKIKEFTDNLLETAELTANRYTAAKPDFYSDVIVLRNGTASYDELKNTLLSISRTDRFADLFILTHGGDDFISVEGGINSDKIRAMKNELGKPLSIRSVYMMNCFAKSLNQAWLDAGAKVTSGSSDINYFPEPTMFFFWNNWKEGQTFEAAAASAYRKTVNLMNQTVRDLLKSVLPWLLEGLADRVDFSTYGFVIGSKPEIEGQGSLTINSDSLTFTQSLSSGLATTVLPVSLLRTIGLSHATSNGKETRTLSSQGVDFIKGWEGFRAQMYNDPVGHCTIGYGTLLHTGNCDGREVEQPYRNGVSDEKATQLLAQKAADFQKIINDSVTVALNQNQNDALVSFVYNVGGGSFRKSTLLRLLNQGNYDAVPTELKKWTKARQNGNLVDLPGLVRRRAAEAELFQKPATGTAQSFSDGELTGIRASMVAELDRWSGVTEGQPAAPGKPAFSEFRTDEYLLGRRHAAAREGTTFTTCVEFTGFALTNAVNKANVKLKVSTNLLNVHLWYKEKRATLPPGAWTDYKPGITERPQPGDIIVLTFSEHVYKPGLPKKPENIKNWKGSFSHVGFVRSVTKNEVADGGQSSETWETVDGGAGLAGKYIYNKENNTYTVKQQGAEMIVRSSRNFYPDTGQFAAGVANQDQTPRILLGWVNIEKIVE